MSDVPSHSGFHKMLTIVMYALAQATITSHFSNTCAAIHIKRSAARVG